MRFKISALLLFFAIGSFAQSIVYSEDFDLPSGADSITAGFSGGISPALGDTSSQLFVSPGHSYHIEGSQVGTDIFFETQAFSTIGKPFVLLEFTHIAKLFSTNQATIQISTDNGASWTTLNASNARYLGEDPSFASLGYFNQISYQTSTSSRWKINAPFAQPDSSWFIKETFDLTGIASDTSLGQGNFTGYASVKLRFNASFVFEIPPLQGFCAGWFIDDIKVTASTCELTPPQISFDYTPTPCYIPNPMGAVPGVSFNSYYIGAQVTENAQFDSGVDSVSCFFRVNGGSWMNQTLALLNPVTGEHRTTLTGILDGDQVDYYLVAWDLSCPNSTRSPDTGHISFTPAVYPSKCNTSLCLSQDVISSFPWTEDFEGLEWIAGSGTGNMANNSHRGDFPAVPDGPWTVIPSESGFYGWSIRTGPTGTPNTGPNGDHTSGIGKYIYSEFSPNPSGTSNRGTLLITPCIDLTDSTTRMLSFFYHSYGADAGNIRIDVDTGSTSSSWWLAYSRVKGPQQFSSSDPWKEAWVSLEPFIGKVVKIRFFVGVPNPNADEIDLAIDDLSITEPVGIDLQMVQVISPIDDPCGPSSGVPVEIRLRNLGPDSLTNIPLAYQLDNGPIIRDTLTGTSVALADSISFIFSANLSFPPSIPHNLKVWSELSGDQDQSNDTLVLPISTRIGNLSTFPYSLDFESSLVIPGSAGNINDPVWTMNENSTSGRFEIFDGLIDNSTKGPLLAGGPNKRAIRTSSNNGPAAIDANLVSSCIDLSSLSAPHLSFIHYVAQGIDLEINIKESTGSWTNLTTIFGSAGFKEAMEMSRVSLAAYSGKSVQLEFRVVNNNINDYTNMLVLDNILIAEAGQNDLGIGEEVGTLRRIAANSTSLGSFDLDLYKSMTISPPSTQLHVEFTSICKANAPVVTGNISFTPVFPFNAPNTVQQIPAINLSDTLKADRYMLKAWLTTSGDSLHFNDTLYQECLVQDVINVPYFNDFESCNDQFLSNGPVRQWQKGTPSMGAYSGNAAFVTNLDTGLISGSGEEKLVPPFFTGLDTLALVELRFYHRFDFNGPIDNNYGTIQYLDNGIWKPIANANNFAPGMVLSNLNGYVFHGSSTGAYQYSSILLDQVKKPGLNIFRFLTSSDIAGASNWEIDDFEIHVPPQNSASPTALMFDSGFPQTNNQVSLEVKNTGARALSEVMVDIYDQNGNLLLSDNVQIGIPSFPVLRNSKAIVSLNGTLPLNTGSNNLMIVTSLPNQLKDALPIDDTLLLKVEVLSKQDTFPYCTDFEMSSELLSYTNGINDSFWYYGSPSKSILNGAYSGNNAWISVQQGDYPALADHYLYTRDFDLVANKCYELSFFHWFETEQNFDGGNVEFSIDGGQSWQVLGSERDSGWYNTPYVQALDAIHPGFTGSSGSWIRSFKSFKLFNSGSIRFRFRFASTATVHNEGWMIDDLCVEEISGWCNQVQQEEYLVGTPGLNLYPNPATDVLFLEHSNLSYNQGMLDLQIYSAVGELVLNMMAAQKQSGMYML